MKKLIVILAAVVLFGGFARAGTWTTLDVPGAIQTRIRDIDGGNLVGYYLDNSGLRHGFIRSGTTWTTLDVPGASYTYAYSIDGSNIVGYYQDASLHSYGFLYNVTAQSWTDIPITGLGIDGDNIVGDNQIYNMATQTTTTLNRPGASGTTIYGISGNNVVGHSDPPPESIGYNGGFLYNGTTWTTLQAPGEPAPVDTWVTDIDGGNIVGYYRVWGDHGFLYNGTKWTILDAPGATFTKIWGIDGYILVGSYQDGAGIDHGFVYEIPEPASVLLFIVGAGVLGLRRKRG